MFRNVRLLESSIQKVGSEREHDVRAATDNVGGMEERIDEDLALRLVLALCKDFLELIYHQKEPPLRYAPNCLPIELVGQSTRVAPKSIEQIRNRNTFSDDLCKVER